MKRLQCLNQDDLSVIDFLDTNIVFCSIFKLYVILAQSGVKVYVYYSPV